MTNRRFLHTTGLIHFSQGGTMIVLRKSSERGHSDHGWLDSRHTFSFADYYDPKHMQFGTLRVINEDRVQPDRGFGTHGHRDMEILSYVLEGPLAHADSMGETSILRPGDVQRMTAGTGVRHSESNPSSHEPVHFLQIWIIPHTMGLTPEYEQKHFSREDKKNRLCLVVSPDGRDGSLTIHQEVFLYASVLEDGGQVTLALEPGRRVWVQVASGASTVNGKQLAAGDGAAITDEPLITLTGGPESEVLLFDLPMT